MSQFILSQQAQVGVRDVAGGRDKQDFAAGGGPGRLRQQPAGAGPSNQGPGHLQGREHNQLVRRVSLRNGLFLSVFL